MKPAVSPWSHGTSQAIELKRYLEMSQDKISFSELHERFVFGDRTANPGCRSFQLKPKKEPWYSKFQPNPLGCRGIRNPRPQAEVPMTKDKIKARKRSILEFMLGR